MDVKELQRRLAEHAESVKALKKTLGPTKKEDPSLLAAIAQLKVLKEAVAAAEKADPAEVARLAAARAEKELELATRRELEAIFVQRGFFFPSNEIHNGPAGFFDFGPIGCAIKQNLLQLWRNWFVLYESMLEIEVTNTE